MTFQEYDDVLSWLKSCWPGTRAYVAADEVYQQFAGLNAAAGWQAARAMFAEGRAHAPTLSEWLSQTQAAAARTGEVERRPCTSHTWAIVEYRDEEGLRDIMCAVCHEERTVSSTTVRTASEIEDARR